MKIRGGILIGPGHNVGCGTLGLVLNDVADPRKKFLVTAMHVLSPLTSPNGGPLEVWHPFAPPHWTETTIAERMVEAGFRKCYRLCTWQAPWGDRGPLREPDLSLSVGFEDFAAVEIDIPRASGEVKVPEIKVAEIVDIGQVTQAATVNLGDHVRMYGASSGGIRHGRVARIGYTTQKPPLNVVFGLLIEPVGPPSKGGDSGAAWVNDQGGVVGLHLGKKLKTLTDTPEWYAVAAPIARVLQHCRLAFPASAPGCVVQ